MGTIGLQSGLPEKSPARPWASSIAQKRERIVRACGRRLLETPFEPFNDGVLTLAERCHALWHWASIPEALTVDHFHLMVRGRLDWQLVALLTAILGEFEPIDYVAVSLCSASSPALLSGRAQSMPGLVGSTTRWCPMRRNS
jgi:hypothetical protein